MPPRPEPVVAERPFEVWPENWPAWEAFHLCTTQWRSAPMGGLLGLDYTAVEIVLRAHSIPIQTLKDLQHIEAGALAEFRKHEKE